jgi:hypothetical protein
VELVNSCSWCHSNGSAVDHTDAAREYAYRLSPMGRLDKALDEARQCGWLVVDMRAD